MTLAARRITGARSVDSTVISTNVRKLREIAHPARTLFICVASTSSTAAAQCRKVTTTAV
jgi:hypothetical protein